LYYKWKIDRGSWLVSEIYFGRTRTHRCRETFLKIPSLTNCLLARVHCIPRTPPPRTLKVEMPRTRLLLFVALLSFVFAVEMPSEQRLWLQRDSVHVNVRSVPNGLQKIVNKQTSVVASIMLKEALNKHQRYGSMPMRGDEIYGMT